MAFTIRQSKIYRSITVTSRKYCENKSLYQRDEEGPKPRIVHGKQYPEWRKPWIKRDGEWYSKLSLFVEKSPNPDIMTAFQRLPKLTVQDVKDWWADMKSNMEIFNQKYLPERVAALGTNLAAIHFFTYRSCALRLKNSKEWIKGDIMTLKLPNHFVEGFYVEAVDCTNFHHNGIRYEGIENLSGLNFLKWLSLKNNKYVDVWCLDRLAGQNSKTLEFLDISGCNLCAGGVYALARMSALKYLIISDPGDNIELQATLSILEEENPNLLIKTVN